MPPEDFSRCPIDGTRIQKWLRELLDLRGPKTKPQIVDLEKAVCTVELSQGGFSSENQLDIVTQNTVNLNGLNVYGFSMDIDCRYAENPEVMHGRVTSQTFQLFLDLAGAAALAGRVAVFQTTLLPDTGGTSVMVGHEAVTIAAAQGYYFFHPLTGWNGIVPPGYAVWMQVALQPDYIGAGPLNFGAGDRISFNVTGIKKAHGGQLPL